MKNATPTGARRRTRHAAAALRLDRLVLALGALPVLVAGCTPVDASQAGSAPVLYVANGLDGTVSRLDTSSGRAAGAPLPAGPAPWRIVPGSNGSMLIQPTTMGRSGELQLVTRVAGSWTTRPVELEAGASNVEIAGDGGRHAVVAYHASSGSGGPALPRCRLALVDFTSRKVEGVRTVCTGRERVVGVALDDRPGNDPGHPELRPGGQGVAYVAIWQPPAATAAGPATVGGRVVAIDLTTGAVLAAAPVYGVPGRITLVRGAGPGAPRLLVVAADLIVDPHEDASATYNEYLQRAAGSTVVSLDAITLSLEHQVSVRPPVRALAAPPGGRDAYALGGQGQLMHLDLVTGQVRRLAALPGGELGLSLAATADYLYVPDPMGERVWALDPRTGRVRSTLPTGRHPIGLAVG